MISGTRCLLTYIVFPWVLPVLGIAGGVGPVVGVIVGVVAIRVQPPQHPPVAGAAGTRWHVPLMTLNSIVIVFLLVLIAIDMSRLVS